MATQMWLAPDVLSSGLSEHAVPTIDPVPSWLEVPPSTDIPPAIDTLTAELPIRDLSWEDFERLCLRLARSQSDVLGARLYGTRGQGQEGIDLFARFGEPEEYRVYQCKRVKSLEPSVIVEAVDKFLEGSWAARATEFVLCSTDDLRTVDREEAFEAQRLRLGQRGIKLVPWMNHELSELMRGQTDVVHDFFGQSWVERFCGAEAASTTMGRIAPSDLASLRTKLRGLYVSVFGVHDQGLATASEQPLPLYDRYIVHELIESRTDDPAPERERPRTTATEGRETPERGLRPTGATPRNQRISLEYEIPSAPGALRVLLGGPGSGKSAALRYLALDLLSDSPRLAAVARVWGRRLPIWIPFGTWVERIERDDREASLVDVVKHWLLQWNEGDLFPLVEQALKDKRLLLLVDGLDEWTSEEAAGHALALLRVFVERQGIPALITSRPHGFQSFASILAAWRSLELAPLSPTQQRKMAEQWFTQRHRSASGGLPIHAATIQKQAEAALTELYEIPDGAALAEVPLLLSILLVLKAEDVELPSNRFKAYAELTRHLMLVQPRRRALSAQRKRRAISLLDDALESAYAFLAYSIHRNYPSGTIPVSTAREYFEQVLEDESFGLAYSADDASRFARELIDVGESVSGLLVKRSPRELGFYHRSIQEHLAAAYLSSVSEREMLAELAAHASDPQWRDVILAVASRAASQEVVSKIVDAIRSAAPKHVIAAQRRMELSTEIAAGPAPCSVAMRTDLITSACTEIEEGWSLPHRAALLQAVLSGLSRQSVKRTLVPRLRRWFPERSRYRGPLLKAVGKWSGDMAWAQLRLALIDEDHFGEQLVAAETIAERWGGDPVKGAELLALARRPYVPEARAAICKALIDGWPSDESLDQILGADGSTLCSELRVVEILRKVSRGHRDDSDRDVLLDLMSDSSLHYAWDRRIMATLLSHWPGDVAVRDFCLASVDRTAGSRRMGLGLERAWSILLDGFPMDDAVATAIIQELGNEYPQFAHVDWSILGRQFRDHPALAQRLEVWIANSSPHHNTEVAGAALVARSQESKRKLLALLRLGEQGFWAARALLEGWGMVDAEVATALRSMNDGDNRTAGWFAEWLPEIIADADKCYRRLLELLADRDVNRPDFVVRGLQKLGRLEGNREFMELALGRAGDDVNFAEQAVVGVLIRHYSGETRVRDLALREIANPDGLHATVAEGFAHDQEICDRLAEFVAPLHVELRRLIAEHFRRFGLHDPTTLELCADFPSEQEHDVATTMSLAFHRALEAQGAEADAHVAVLKRELACYGHYYQSRRQAAYAGAIELGRYELIDEATETIGDPVPLRIGLSSSRGEPNAPLIRQVMDHWPQLEQRYPQAALARLQSPREVHLDRELGKSAWAEVADEVDRDSGAERILLDWLNTADTEVLEPSLLRFLSRREPGSRRLRDHCERILNAPSQGWGHEERLEQATQILVQQFAGDDELWARVDASVRSSVHMPYGALTALARARPRSATVKEYAGPLWRSPTGRAARLVFCSLCAVGTAGEVVAGVDHYWGLGKSYGVWLYRPLIDRLARDSEVREAMEKVTASHQSDAVRVAFAVPITAVGPLAAPLAKELGDVLARQLDPSSYAGFTFDGRVGMVRPIASVIVEVMGLQSEAVR